MKWWAYLLISLVFLLILSILFYRHFFKRFYDIVFSFILIIILIPLFLIMMLIGTAQFKSSPFFIQERVGKNEKIFKMIKFKSMNDKKDSSMNLLPDKDRITKYGNLIRKTSLDELPEVFNVFIGNMSFIGPRPLLVRYINRYNEFQHHRHDVRPGITGYSQINGRNLLTWETKFKLDVYYTKHISFFGDIKIICKTIICIVLRKGISSETSATMEEFMGNEENRI